MCQPLHSLSDHLCSIAWLEWMYFYCILTSLNPENVCLVDTWSKTLMYNKNKCGIIQMILTQQNHGCIL